MTTTIDYYLTLQSPFAYLGHERFVAIARAAAARVTVLPVDLGGKIFPVSGGLPLAQRAPQRLAYRLLELQRFAEHLGLPLNLKPAHFPVSGDAAARLVITVEQQDGTDAALVLSGAVLSAVWAEERNIADDGTLAQLLDEHGLNAARLEQSRTPEVQAHYEANTRRAIDAHVFGAPSYVVDGELFWGQDRLDFVERRLLHLRAP